jgi:hypothetical protein
MLLHGVARVTRAIRIPGPLTVPPTHCADSDPGLESAGGTHAMNAKNYGIAW